MSDLTFAEKRKLERVLGMASGYVLNFSNRTFEEFVVDSTGRNIFASRYDYGSGSKANRLRAFWQKEDNRVVGKLLKDLLDYNGETSPSVEMCRLIVSRLLNGSPAPAPEVTVSPQQSQVLSQLKDEFGYLALEKAGNKQKAEFTDTWHHKPTKQH